MRATQQSTLIVLLASLLLVSACTTITDLQKDVSERVFGKELTDPPEPLVEIKATASIQMLWQAKVGDSGNFEFTPAVEAGYAYVASAEGTLAKLDVIDGKQSWRVNVGEKLTGGVGVGGSLVVVGTQNGAIYAYDVAGKLQWKSKLSSEVLSAPKYFDGMVIVRTGDSRIYGINANDGSRKWVYDRTSPALTLRSSAGVVVDGGAVYAGFAGGKLVAIRADNGKILWEASVAQPKGVTEIERIADITSLPVVDGPLVYAVAYQGRIAAVDRSTGRVVWNRDISSLSGLSAEDARIFVSHAVGSVYALDYTTGKTFWRQGALKNRQLTAPVPMGSLIAVGDLEGNVHFLSREDGAFAARVKTNNSAILPQMTLVNSNTVLVQSRDGGVYAIQVK
ncbi:MAG: outer membrane protein assembly factor BamB [Methylotenera sp.]|nr:outer membrane protein assembly factor BamB [Methylotenera sp.]MDP1753989.1 outer membrane protein assembly factor BamB [Methylotenera sp.]MDP1960356.1 outer membrane protein assembly factor BamB [Methylotenera sp.]MDP3206833.1 outer membrane protein assembly factor BamB [Methylotenera sp.]MDP3302830.1 outer membrane protein assembly factor BamB [Methylotenera sp.]